MKFPPRKSRRALLLPAIALLLLFQAQAALAQGSKGLLWAVETGHSTVFLLGSMHALSAGSYPLAEPIEEAYRRSKAVAFETDLGAMQGPDFQRKLMQRALLPEGDSLKGHLSEDTFRRLSRYLTAAGLPEANFERFRPWMCALALAVFEYQRLGFSPQNGVDQHFYDLARRDGKRIIPFEPVDFQLGLLSELDKEDQDALVRQTLTELGATRDMAGELARAWQSGDAGLMEQLTQKSFGGFPRIYDTMITRRNRSWLPRVEELLQGREDALVIVGAAHLIGPDGLIELLRDKGYRVTRR